MKNNVIFLGCTANYGYHFSAVNTKTEYLARGLSEQGDLCTIHNGIHGTDIVSRTEKTHKDFAEVLTYPNKGGRFLSWIVNIRRLYIDLKTTYSEDLNNIIVLESPYYHIFCIYVLLARILRYKIVCISHEWGPTVSTVHIVKKPSVWIFSKTFGYMVDGILPISEYIIGKIMHFNKPYIKVPVLSDFDGEPYKKEDNYSYFLYCASAAYDRVIKPMIDSFAEFALVDKKGVKMILVLSGSEKTIKVIEDYIVEKQMANIIEIKTKLPYEELFELYVNASALIIPLDPNSEQDWARFSQKIAEYTSAASPIISCKVGEVEYYFKDKETAILCDYSKEGFLSAFQWVNSNKKESSIIGEKSYSLGEKYFNYKTVGEQLSLFFKKL